MSLEEKIEAALRECRRLVMMRNLFLASWSNAELMTLMLMSAFLGQVAEGVLMNIPFFGSAVAAAVFLGLAYGARVLAEKYEAEQERLNRH